MAKKDLGKEKILQTPYEIALSVVENTSPELAGMIMDYLKNDAIAIKSLEAFVSNGPIISVEDLHNILAKIKKANTH